MESSPVSAPRRARAGGIPGPHRDERRRFRCRRSLPFLNEVAGAGEIAALEGALRGGELGEVAPDGGGEVLAERGGRVGAGIAERLEMEGAERGAAEEFEDEAGLYVVQDEAAAEKESPVEDSGLAVGFEGLSAFAHEVGDRLALLIGGDEADGGSTVGEVIGHGAADQGCDGFEEAFLEVDQVGDGLAVEGLVAADGGIEAGEGAEDVGDAESGGFYALGSDVFLENAGVHGGEEGFLRQFAGEPVEVAVRGEAGGEGIESGLRGGGV